MAVFKPLNAVGLVICDGRFTGTCFAFQQPTHLLTASHCITSQNIKVLSVVDNRLRTIAYSIPHETADCAILVTGPYENDPLEPFWGSVGNYSLAEEYLAYGFPEDAIGPNQGRPTARVFTGNFQRFMDHSSFMGYRYLAGELSTACPPGLSGGPLFRPGAHPMITGLVTETIEVSTLIDSQETVESDGTKTIVESRSVINYGIALMLDSIKEFLDENVPARTR